MAKPKKKVLIEKLPAHIRIYCDGDVQRELEQIEGITWVDDMRKDLGGSCIIVHIDPRYDIDELVAEVSTLLAAEVPDIFRE